MRTSPVVIAALFASVQANQAVDITEGILMGALHAEGFDDVAQCIKDGEEIVSDAEAAFKDFEGHSAGEIVDGLKKVADAVKTIKAGMSDCSHLKADWQKLESMAAAFSSPTAFAWHVGKDLLVNGIDIYHEIDTAVSDAKSGNWKDFGFNVGEAAAKVLIGAEEAQKAEADKKKMATVMTGALNEFGGKFDAWALLQCIDGEDKAAIALDLGVQNLETAYKEFSGDKKKAAEDAFGGLLTLFAAFQSAKQGLPACKAVYQDVAKLEGLESATEVLRHPFQNYRLLENDLQLNGYSVLYEVEQLVWAYRGQDYEQFGHILAKIMKLSTKENPQKERKLATLKQEPLPGTQINRADLAEVVQGFLAGSGVGNFNFLDLLLCVDAADEAAMVLYQDIALFEEAMKDKDAMEGVASAIMLYSFIQQLRQTVLPTCEAVAHKKFNWGHYDEMLSTLEHPEKHLEVLGKDAVMNGKTITADLQVAMASYHNGNMFDFGYQTASALSIATEDKNLFLY